MSSYGVTLKSLAQSERSTTAHVTERRQAGRREVAAKRLGRLGLVGSPPVKTEGRRVQSQLLLPPRRAGWLAWQFKSHTTHTLTSTAVASHSDTATDNERRRGKGSQTHLPTSRVVFLSSSGHHEDLRRVRARAAR